MAISAADIIILYGSQTGNAEDMAKRIGRQAKLNGFSILVQPIDNFPLKRLQTVKFVIFVCSTTGHGQEPENMKNFYNFIRRRDLPKDCLKNLKYCTYGLGDSSYVKFNYVSKILFKRLKECGADPIQELVASDEQHQFGCDGVIYPKLDELWPKLFNLMDKKSDYTDEKLPESSYQLDYVDMNPYHPDEPLFSPEFYSRFNIKTATCIRNQRITAQSHFQDTRHLCFRTHPDPYEPGDVCTIFPKNLDENVTEFLKLLDLDPQQRFSLRKKDDNFMVDYLYDFIPKGLRIKDLVEYYLDIQAVPKRSFFEYLWPFSDDELERVKLREFASTEGQEEVYEYCIRPKRSILEVLLDFPKTVRNIKFEYLFDLVPPIKPRSFSIASSQRVHPNEIHLIVGVVNYKTIMVKSRKGLCSNYLARLSAVDDPEDLSPKPKNEIRYFIRESSFRLPINIRTPIIMIGPGLGIAPFRGFIEERVVSDDEDQANINHLYFGCRYSDKDYYFKEELKSYADKSLLNLKVAFSRETPKQYIQDILRQDTNTVRELLKDRKAIVYIAGNSKLPEELRILLGELLADESGDTNSIRTDCEALVTRLEIANRIRYDCW